MRILMKALFLGGPIAVVVSSAVLPLPLAWQIGGMVLGMLLFQLGLVGSLEPYLPNKRRFLALRDETDRLLALVRDLNTAVQDARALGIPEDRYTMPILVEMHAVVDTLPRVAGVEEIVGVPAARPLELHRVH